MNLEQNIEAVLFYKSEPVAKPFLAKLLGASQDEIESACTTLSSRLKTTGLSLIVTETEVELRIHNNCSQVIESLQKDERKREIGKAGAETLAIVLYRGPITRTEIDTIRGVNSNFILRNLLMRGLIERQENPDDQRTYTYAVTTELLGTLGITKKQELPEYQTIMDALDVFEQSKTTT